jgi:hypothetical protein
MDEFIQQLLAERGIPESVDEETRQQLAEDLSSRLNDFINKRLIESMPEDVLAKFEEQLDSGNATTESLQQFVADNLPDKEQVTANALMEFRALYLGPKA